MQIRNPLSKIMSEFSEELFVGIDTSNYTTSCALIDIGGRVIANIKRPLAVADKACGLRQSDAVFAHIKNLPSALEELKNVLEGRIPAAVGVSAAPRDAEDSYMPCFLSGVAAAEAMAAGTGIPLYRFSHQSGHITAALETSGASEIIGDSPFLSFHVSGGTTELLYAERAEGRLCVKLIGGTEDLNAGQAIDRTGVRLGMHFPCGPQMEKEALEYSGPREHFRVPVKDCICNLSGLENLALKLIEGGAGSSRVCAFVFDYISKILIKLTQNARQTYGNLPVLFAGGVISNSIIKNNLSQIDNVFFTEPQYSADNAVGTAFLCRNKWTDERKQ